ncbi:MAG: DUF3039 domain-containing protein [Betaproteobacteria bacterium]|nr:DUF3039 domain-containing protein [Betaproteobacteria bacterium]NCA23543.1 DUF3039 domain-containing protein [Betaproteobacteria bacterium]
MSSSDTKKEITVDTTNGDHDLFAHYADENDIMEAFVNGVPIMALCGKIWVPSRDGSKYPVCPECAEIYEQIVR